jgi:hypothetical protein
VSQQRDRREENVPDDAAVFVGDERDDRVSLPAEHVDEIRFRARLECRQVHGTDRGDVGHSLRTDFHGLKSSAFDVRNGHSEAARGLLRGGTRRAPRRSHHEHTTRGLNIGSLSADTITIETRP